MDYSPTFLYGNNKHQFWPDLDNHIREGISIIDYDLFGRFFKKVVSELGRIHLPLTDGPSVKCV